MLYSVLLLSPKWFQNYILWVKVEDRVFSVIISYTSKIYLLHRYLTVQNNVPSTRMEFWGALFLPSRFLAAAFYPQEATHNHPPPAVFWRKKYALNIECTTTRQSPGGAPSSAWWRSARRPRPSTISWERRLLRPTPYHCSRCVQLPDPGSSLGHILSAL